MRAARPKTQDLAFEMQELQSNGALSPHHLLERLKGPGSVVSASYSISRTSCKRKETGPLEGTISRLLLERRFQHTSPCPEHRVVLLLKR